MEMVLKDFCKYYGMHGIALRYFNPIGADPKMRSGLHIRRPSLVVGKMVDTALGNLPEFQITGTTWPTRDGTGIRDYIHVWDLAQAHVLAVTDFPGVFERAGNPADNYLVINLGNGHGVTVREILAAFEKVWGKPIPKGEYPPRPGDVRRRICQRRNRPSAAGLGTETVDRAGHLGCAQVGRAAREYPGI